MPLIQLSTLTTLSRKFFAEEYHGLMREHFPAPITILLDIMLQDQSQNDGKLLSIMTVQSLHQRNLSLPCSFEPPKHFDQLLRRFFEKVLLRVEGWKLLWHDEAKKVDRIVD